MLVTGILICLAVLSQTTEGKKTYQGYRLVSIDASDDDSAAIQQLNSAPSEDVIIMEGSAVNGRPMTVVVSPTYYSTMEESLQKDNIRYDVIYNDLEPILREVSITQNSSDTGSFNFSVYHTLAEIEDFMNQTALNNTDIARLLQIGSSYEGRPIYAIHISTDFTANREAFWFDGGIHAREWIAPATMVYFIDQIISLYRSGTDDVITNVLDIYDIYIMAVLNVDGFLFSHSDDRLWRKTRSPNLESECFGTDANRNFDIDFGESGVNLDPCHNNYPGTSAFSEPEVKAVADFIQSHQVVLYIAYHSWRQAYMTPYAYTSSVLPPNYDELAAILEEATQALKDVTGEVYEYGPIPTFFGNASGSSVDYMYEVLGITYSFGVELRDNGTYNFELPEDQILPTATENFAALRVIMNRVLEANATARVTAETTEAPIATTEDDGNGGSQTYTTLYYQCFAASIILLQRFM